MDLDNPSYFSVPEKPSTSFSTFGVRTNRMGNSDSISSASECSLTRQLTPPRNQNMKFRILRSVSSNSADSNQEMLIRGEPRLSDFAPEIAFKHQATNSSNSLKPTKYDPHSDLMYCPLPTSEETEEHSSDEVFLTEDSARYYNFPSSKRRHSIGTFMGRDRTNSVASSSRSFKEDFPQAIVHASSDGVPTSIIDDHSLRHASYPRKRCTRCTRGTKQANMDDILIVSLNHSEAAALWVEYFSNYFQQISNKANSKAFKILYFGAEEILETKDIKALTEKTSGVKLQLVVVCPNLLDFIAQNPEKCELFGDVFLADRTLALLLGVADTDLTDVHKKAFPTYFQWQRQVVGQDQDENFTKEFLSQAMAILSRIWKQQSSVIAQEKSCFSVTPKKIRQGQNSIYIILTYPLQKEDTVKISMERNGEMYEMKSTKKRNPYLIKVTIPEHLTEVTAIVNVLVEKNGSIIGRRPVKCESKLRELEQILRSSNNPIEFMCQTLGFTPADRENLDNWMVQAFQRNLPQNFNVLGNNNHTPFSGAVQVHKRSSEEYPTLLHFAAKFGLEKLSMQLLDCPGADIAYEIKNIHNLTPVEIAEENEHLELCSILRDHMKMNEMIHSYAKLKEMSMIKTIPPLPEDDGYLAPNEINTFYKPCPSPRPVDSSPFPTTPVSDCTTPLGYTAMNTPAHLTRSKEDFKKPHNEPVPKTKNEPDIKGKTLKAKTPDIIEDKVQQELAEIINDFKNNVHSLDQVEKLVEEWKNRNDVQKSFREKQQQLCEMRLKYEQIQHDLKNSLKKPTPFERFKIFKKMFSRSKHIDEKHDISSPLPTINLTVNSDKRPISALSTSSSGSSGRMSTISGCSLGDSGTHSDNEDRKNMLGNHGEEEFRTDYNKAIMELQYTPLPAPKPVKHFSPRHTFETIEEKPIRPDTLPIPDNFYIQFPPSGKPIPGVSETEASQEESNEYMNFPADNTRQSHEYMNFKAPTSR